MTRVRFKGLGFGVPTSLRENQLEKSMENDLESVVVGTLSIPVNDPVILLYTIPYKTPFKEFKPLSL